MRRYMTNLYYTVIGGLAWFGAGFSSGTIGIVKSRAVNLTLGLFSIGCGFLGGYLSGIVAGRAGRNTRAK